MSRRMYLACVVCLFGAASLVQPANAQETAGRTIKVHVTYTGSGTVDDSHKIFVALWDTPDFAQKGSHEIPVGIQSTNSKTGTVTFADVQKIPAYISAGYDPAGKWDGQSGPPPEGASLGMYTKNPPNPEPINVEAGKTAHIELKFDDRVKMMQ
jgi:predicted secreted protein